MLTQFVRDLDARVRGERRALARRLCRRSSCSRGTKALLGSKRRGAWYASTSMRRDVAEGFADKESPEVARDRSAARHAAARAARAVRCLAARGLKWSCCSRAS